jgi:capsule polysaccharide export protein KpsC/LpsZ
LPLAQSFETIDHVYTLTSLSGLEALLRGIKVTTLGRPFYAGFGLTDDRLARFREQRKLTLEELVAGAYLIYPKYFDPTTGKKMQALDVVKNIKKTIELSNGTVEKLETDEE